MAQSSTQVDAVVEGDLLARQFLFVDEAGNFDFSLKTDASKYFILVSVHLQSCDIERDLLELRRTLVWQGIDLTSAFHATEDRQEVRDKVFDVINQYDFRIDATILEKRKTIPSRQSQESMYDLAWYLHMKHVIPQTCSRSEEVMIVAASIGTKKKQQQIGTAIRKTSERLLQQKTMKLAHWSADSDPCLQVADYCCWAIQRKWERNDTRSYDLVKTKIHTEKDIFSNGDKHYY